MLQKHSYVGPRTTVTVPSPKSGEPDELLEFVPGGLVSLTTYQLEQPIIKRYLRRGALSLHEEPAKRTTRKAKAKVEVAE